MKRICRHLVLLFAFIILLSPTISVYASSSDHIKIIEPYHFVEESIFHEEIIYISRPDIKYEEDKIWKRVNSNGYYYEGYLRFKGYKFIRYNNTESGIWQAVYSGTLDLVSNY